MISLKKFNVGDRVHFEGRPATVNEVDRKYGRVDIIYDGEEDAEWRKMYPNHGDWYDVNELLPLSERP